jgi:hypothetical protein
VAKRCESCGKRIYTSENQAERAIEERMFHGAPALRPYLCPYHKDRYHVTSKWWSYRGT